MLKNSFVISIAGILMTLSLTLPVLCAAGMNHLRPIHGPAARIWIRQRVPSAATIHRYKNDPKFNYSETVLPTTTLWDEIKLMIMRQLKKVFMLEGDFHIWTTPIFIITGIALIYVVSTLFRSDIQGIFFWKKKSNPGEDVSIREGIKGKNYSAIIQEVLIRGDYREAIRIFYNWTLSRLLDKKLIESTREKTNLDYVRELSGTRYAADFHELTRIFEYTWYGYFIPAESEFILIKNLFTSFMKELGE